MARPWLLCPGCSVASRWSSFRAGSALLRLDQQAAQFELSALAPMVALLLLDMIQGLSRFGIVVPARPSPRPSRSTPHGSRTSQYHPVT